MLASFTRLAEQVSAGEEPCTSFRDPAGSVRRTEGRILRRVEAEFLPEFEAFLKTRTAQEAESSGRLIASHRIDATEWPGAAALFEHERIPFPSYPYEWPAEMLHAAGNLTLDLAEAALDEGFGLKDATPYNVLFRGPRAVFVDVLSFESRDPLNAAWAAYGQFARTFLLPLYAAQRLNLPAHETLAAHRDGVEPERLYPLTSLRHRLTPTFLQLIGLPKWLGARHDNKTEAYRPQPSGSPEQAQYVLKSLLKSCRSQLNALAPNAEKDSAWSGYLAHKSLYTAETLQQKEAFVRRALDQVRPVSVLDVGANEGHFSFLAAGKGAATVAIDYDPAVVGSIWRRAKAEGLNVLPLVVNLAQPTPATGWRNREQQSFLDRARGQFDLVLMLAVIHHLLISERVPLTEILRLAADLSRSHVLIEFVGPGDAMFRKLVRGRDELYAHLTQEYFRAAAQEQFEILETQRVEGPEEGFDRCLYLLRRR